MVSVVVCFSTMKSCHVVAPDVFLLISFCSVIKGIVMKVLWLSKFGIRAGNQNPVVPMIIYCFRLEF